MTHVRRLPVPRFAVATVAAAAMAISGLALASPASASTTITRNDAVCITATSPDTTGARVDASTGDVLSITGNFANCNTISVQKSQVASQSDVVLGGGGTLNFTDTGFNYIWSGSADFTSVQITFGSGSGFGSIGLEKSSLGVANAKTNWLVALNRSSSGSSSSTNQAPAPVLQQFGMPATGTCEDVASPELNWAGVDAGGWGVSWAQWMNDGNGGPVCSRSLVYNTVLAKWMVG